jgi:tape measure domain-containing protein
MSEVGAVWVDVLPSLRRFGPDLTRQMAGQLPRAGQDAGRKLGGSIETGVGGQTRGRRIGSAVGSGIATGVSRAGSSIERASKGAALAIGGIGLAAAAGAVKAGSFGLRIAASNEQAQISFTTMLGSARKASGFLTQLQAFAAKTPFEFPELQTAASSLISVGIRADKVIPIMTSLGNTTAGMGTGSEGIKRATVALQQMSAAGKISGEDLNQLRDAGIPVFDLLSAATGKTTKQIADMAAKGKLGRKELDQLMKALETGKGLERFNGLMDKQSASLTGMVSTFKDTLGQGLANAVAPSLPLIKQLLDMASGGLAVALPKVGTGLREAAGALQLFIGLLSGRNADVTSQFANDHMGAIVTAASLTRTGFEEVRDAWERLKGVDFGGIFASLKRTVAGIDLHSIVDSLGRLGSQAGPQLASIDFAHVGDGVRIFGAALGVVADHSDLLIRLMPALVAGFVAVKGAQAVNNLVGRQSLIGFALQIGTNIALTRSNTALARSEGAVATAKNISIVTTTRQLAGLIAQKIAAGAAAVATKAMAAGQWLLNAALSANPISIVVVALAGLAAGIIYAYKHSETFRTIVDGAFHAIATAGSWMWNSVLKPTFRSLADTFLAVAGAIVHGAATAFGWVPGIGGKLKSAAGKFGTFRDDVNRALGGVKDRDVSVNARLRLYESGYNTQQGRAPGAARGGLQRGPGGGTDDLLPRWLSNGEYVVRARAVQRYGTAFFDALNAEKVARGGPVGDAGNARGVRGVPGLGSVSPLERSVAALNRTIDARAVAAMKKLLASGAAGGAAAVAWAMRHLGIPYSWGGGRPSGPTLGFGRGAHTVGYDCSSWTQAAWAAAGKRLPRTSAEQYAATRRISAAMLRPGDLGFVGFPVHHVGLYVGGGRWASEHRTGTSASVNRGDGWNAYGRVFDKGGMLQRYGAHLLMKSTTRPERVLSPRQTESFDRLVTMLGRVPAATAARATINPQVLAGAREATGDHVTYQVNHVPGFSTLQDLDQADRMRQMRRNARYRH